MLFQLFVSSLTFQYSDCWKCSQFASQSVRGSPIALWRVEKSVYNYLHNVQLFTSMWQISAMSHQRRLSSKRYNLQHRLHLPEDLRDNLRRSQGCHLPTMTESDQRSLKKSKDLTLKNVKDFNHHLGAWEQSSRCHLRRKPRCWIGCRGCTFLQ